MKVELINIHKTFGRVHANNAISLTVPAGSIQGILGENGAGKSTLMKILSGFFHPDSGSILLDGKPVRIENPADAIQHGIGMLHQDPLDFPPLRVLDNFLLGRAGGLFPNATQARRDFMQLQSRFDFSIDPDTYVDRLTVGERQQLEILRLLWLGARVLIMDEPTTGISSMQRQKLFAALRKLVSEGMTVLFVSHKLEEVEGLCDRVAVLQSGRLVGQAEPPYITTELVRMMFGKNISLAEKTSLASQDTCLVLSDLTIGDARLDIHNVSLKVRRGEIIGLAGMEGSGQRQFLRTLGGLMHPAGGKIIVNGINLAGKPYPRFRNMKVAFVPASRLEEGLVPGLSLAEHFALVREQTGFVIQRERIEDLAEEHIEAFSIRGTPQSRVEALSGGNQQRALLSLLDAPLSLILLEHPTRGLDIESAIWIWGKLKERCENGTSILFISSDLEELLHYSDRVLVFFNGKVSEPLNAAQTSVEELGQLIGGKGFS